MEDSPVSKLVLRYLLHQLDKPTNRHHERYRPLLATSMYEVETLLISCANPQFLALADAGKLNTMVEATSIPTDTSYRGRAIYLHVVHCSDDTIRYYVGQAFNLSWRIRQHLDFRNRRDHPSFHYWGMNSSKADHFLVLGKVEKNVDRSDLFMNVLEMWATLLFQSLAPHSKNETWLPPEVPRLELKGLNVGLPLDTNHSGYSHAEFETLKSAEDKLARDYYLYYTDRRKFRESRRKDWEERDGSTAIGNLPEQVRSSSRLLPTLETREGTGAGASTTTAANSPRGNRPPVSPRTTREHFKCNSGGRSRKETSAERQKREAAAAASVEHIAEQNREEKTSWWPSRRAWLIVAGVAVFLLAAPLVLREPPKPKNPPPPPPKPTVKPGSLAGVVGRMLGRVK